MARIILWIYVLVSAANIIAKFIPSEELNQFTKPLLMPLLIFYVYRQSIGNTTVKVLLLCLALLFSWIGDVVLMYQSDQLYFMIGIALFLAAQVTYVFVLRKTTYQPPRLNVLALVPFLLYGAILFYFLLPAGDFTAPIIIYGLVILTMAVSAYSRKDLTSYKSFMLAFSGSIFFVLSDSILAINAFSTAIPYAGAFIMLTYTVAQLLLVKGILNHAD